MEEKQQQFEITTEFDTAISGLKWKIFGWLAAALFSFLLVEGILIFFIFTDANVLRMQSFNGAIVMAGGLVMVTATSLFLILPTKMIAYESLKIVRDTQAKSLKAAESLGQAVETMNTFVVKVEPVLTELSQSIKGVKLEELALRFERKMDEVMQTVGGNDPVDLDLAKTQIGKK